MSPSRLTCSLTPHPVSGAFGAQQAGAARGLAASSPPGLASSTGNLYPQSDVKCVYIYENQRWNPVTGYTSR